MGSLNKRWQRKTRCPYFYSTKRYILKKAFKPIEKRLKTIQYISTFAPEIFPLLIPRTQKCVLITVGPAKHLTSKHTKLEPALRLDAQ